MISKQEMEKNKKDKILQSPITISNKTTPNNPKPKAIPHRNSLKPLNPLPIIPHHKTKNREIYKHTHKIAKIPKASKALIKVILAKTTLRN